MLISIGGGQRARFEFFRARRRRAKVWLLAVFNRVTEMRSAVEGRRAIARMDARMLADIGLSNGEATVEASRRPWDTVARKF